VSEAFGVAPDGRPVERFELRSGGGAVAGILTWGATLQQLRVAGRDLVVGFPTLDGYQAARNAYVGGVIGRYAGRIAGARFELGGTSFELDRNDGPHSLHGGSTGFDRRVWTPVKAGGASLTLRYESADGELGYPGRLTATATYTLRDDALALALHAITDRETVVNLTSHTYWNLGEGSIDDHLLTVHAHRYTPTDEAGIPTGALADVYGTRFSLLEPTQLAGRAYDVNYVLDEGELVRAAELVEPSNGRRLELFTTEPGLQVYTGELLPAPRGGVALEPQHFPNSPNVPAFPSTVLAPGAKYVTTTVWRWSTLSPT
jgi:aldose 1-epimerase